MKNMARRFLLSTLSFIFAIGLLPASPVKAATTIYVPDNFPTIQAAVNAASAGDTIVVRTGTYTENVKVNKSVTIKSNNGAEATIIQAANPSDHVFEVTADYVSIDGFMIRGADGKDSTYLDGMYLGSAGIYLKNATSCTIINNQITENTDGIFCDYSNSVSILENNVNLNNVHGIWWLNSSNNKINSNNVTNCIFGISCAYTSGDEIAQNMVKDNESNAISLQDSADSKVLANNVTNNGYGIDLFSRVRNNLISGNYITNSKNYGIGLSEASNNTVCNNYILNSVWWGIHIQFSPDANTLYLNNFINNNINVLFNQSTVMNWHSSEQITYTYNSKTFRDYLGNYWSNYTGSDVNGDGIGDTPYSIDSDRDNYPLVEPFENYGIGAAPKQMTKPTDVEGTIIPFRGYYDIVDIPKGDPRLNTTAYRYFHEWIGEKTKNGIVYEIYRVYHEGIDVIVPRGTVVKAATSGKVVWVDRVDDSRAGRWVWIEHGNIGKLDGTAVTKISTRYLHLDTIDPNITIGKTVAQGTVIGTVGNTGCPTTTPHLHFEVRRGDIPSDYNYRNTMPLDPLDFVGYPRPEVFFIASCPVDLVVADPGGLIISKNTNQLPQSAQYIEVKYVGDSEDETLQDYDAIVVDDLIIGDYSVKVIPEAGANPTDVYNLSVISGGRTLVLADNVSISNIPSQGYIVRSTQGKIEQIARATIDFDPDTLNLRSKGNVVTVYIELPKGYDVKQINISSIKLNGTIPALAKPTEVGDYDKDGVPDMMVKFDRSAVQGILRTGDKVIITITGKVAGISFEGSDTIKVIK